MDSDVIKVGDSVQLQNAVFSVIVKSTCNQLPVLDKVYTVRWTNGKKVLLKEVKNSMHNVYGVPTEPTFDIARFVKVEPVPVSAKPAKFLTAADITKSISDMLQGTGVYIQN